MRNEITLEIWYDEKKHIWMTKTLDDSSPRNSKTMTVLDFYVENLTSENLPVTKKQIQIIRSVTLGDQRNAAHDTVDKLRMFESAGLTGCNDAIPVKLFCPYGSHMTFLHDVRQNYIKYASEFTFNTVDEKHRLPKKLVRTGLKQWKPASILHTSQYDHLNWTSLIEQSELPWKQKNIVEKTGRFKNASISNENKENTHKTYWENIGTVEKTKPPVFPKQETKTIISDIKKDDPGKFSSVENPRSPLLFKQEIEIDINDNIITPKPKSPKQQFKTFKHNGAAHPMASLFTQQLNIEKDNTITTLKPQLLSGPEYKIEKDNIVLHFNSPVMSKKRKEIDNNNLLNSSLSEEENTVLPLNAPIIEKDIIDYPPCPLLLQGRKINKIDKNDSKEIRKVKTLERTETKDQRKKTWFAKSDHKTKTTIDLDTSTSTVTEPKSKFKKQHRKSRSVMVQPTYLSNNNQEDKKSTKEVNKFSNRKNSVGSSQKETKSEKLSLFRRIYSSPQAEKKLDINDLSLSKRTRRHTQPVGCIQKEFIRELKGKLDKYSSEHAIKGDDPNEKVVWNINI